MKGKHFLLGVVAAAVTGALAYGCSSNNNNGGGGGSDGGGTDGSILQHHDAMPSGDDGNTGEDSPAAPTCPTPIDETNFMPPAYKHAKTMLGACSASDISGYDAACLSGTTGSQANCSNFKTAHPTCFSCLGSNSTDTTWGALVAWKGVQNINVAGCIELTNPSDMSCPQVLESSDECDHAACDSVCPVTDQTTFNAWQMCKQTADAQACGKYTTPATQCLNGGDDAAAAAVCTKPYTSFDDYFIAVAPIFCGGGDAGTAPTDAGPTDAPAG